MSVEGYGRIFLPELLEDDVIRLLAPDTDGDDLGVDGGLGWLVRECREIERQHDLADGEIKQPRAWNTVSAEDDWPIDRLPAIVVILGPADQSVRDEEGIYTEAFRLEVAAVTSARTYRKARRSASRLAMAARAAILQHLTDASDYAAGVDVGPVAPRPIPLRDPERTDTVAAYQIAVTVAVPDTVSDTVSVIAPPADPDVEVPDDPEVDEGAVSVSVTRVSIS